MADAQQQGGEHTESVHTETETEHTRKVHLFGVPVDALTREQMLDRIDETITSRGSLHVGVVNAAKVVNMGRDPALREAVLESDLILADGAAVVLASRVLGEPLPERVTGIGLMYGIFERGMKKGYRVYCLGATEEVSRKVAEKISQDYPGVVLAGRRNGYFSAEEEPQIAQDIADAKADVLLVAITSPKKEQFMARWNDLIKVPVVHGVGGSFDVMAGKVKRAPELWQKLGMEWLYRVKQEPGRLWKRYLVTNTLFLWLLMQAFLKKTLRRSQSSST